jgi:peptidoglycan hydrolase CwlO-like protein
MVKEEQGMWDAPKRARLEWLRQREEEGTLTEAEWAELTQMIAEIETAEAAYLHPATERLEAESAQIEAQNAELARLIRRKEALVQRLKQTLAELDAERQAIEKEQRRVLSGSAPPPP